MAREFTKLGSAYIKNKQYKVQLTGDAVDVAIWAVVLPPLCVPRRYWFRCRMVSDIPGQIPETSAAYRIRGGYVEISHDETFAGMDADVYLNKYFPIQASGDDPWGADADPGEPIIPGAQTILGQYGKERTVFERSQTLGLPDKAVFSDADKILLVDQFKIDGEVKGSPVPLAMPSAFLVGMSFDTPIYSTDYQAVMVGGATGFEGLYDDISAPFIENLESGGHHLGTIDEANPLAWSTKGFYQVTDGTVLDHTAAMNVRTKMTMEVDVYSRQMGKKVWTPG